MKRPHSPSLRRPPGPLADTVRKKTECTLENMWRVPRVSRPVSVLPYYQPVLVAHGQVVAVDLFCGIGGFSQGAAQSGIPVALAVDFNMILLEAHRRNHPSAVHVCMELGPSTEQRLLGLMDRFVSAGAHVHLHGSPPCQQLSSMQLFSNGGHRDYDKAMRLIRWFVEFVQRVQPSTWSFEQVNLACVTDYLDRNGVAYKSINMVNYGIPQRRKRVIAGTPLLVHNLDKHYTEEFVSIRTLTPPPSGATLIRLGAGRMPDPAQTVRHADGTYTNDSLPDFFYSTFDRAPPTVCGGNHHIWIDEQFRTVRQVNNQELLLWQTFPVTYLLPPTAAERMLGIGNALPPLLVQKLLEPLA